MHFSETHGTPIKNNIYQTYFRLWFEISTNFVYNYHRQAKVNYLKFGDAKKVARNKEARLMRKVFN